MKSADGIGTGHVGEEGLSEDGGFEDEGAVGRGESYDILGEEGLPCRMLVGWKRERREGLQLGE